MNTFKITFAALAIAAATATSAFAFNGHQATINNAGSDVYQTQTRNDASVTSPALSQNGSAAVANSVANQQIGR